MPDFTIDEGSYPATTKFSSSFWTRIWFLRIQLKGELASILQRQRVGITAMKIEITRTHFLSDIYSVVAVVLNTVKNGPETHIPFTRVRDKFLNGRTFYLCNSFTRNRTNSVRDCSTVQYCLQESIRKLARFSGSLENEKRRMRASFCPFKNLSIPACKLSELLMMIISRVGKKADFPYACFRVLICVTNNSNVHAFVAFINLSAPWFYMYF